MLIPLPDANGNFTTYRLSGKTIPAVPRAATAQRVMLSAAHVVANPFVNDDPATATAIDWEATLAFRRHLDDLGLGIAEAMDTAQRGAGLGWPEALQLIRLTREELPNANVFNGCGTDQLNVGHANSVDDVRRAYFEQVEAIQSCGGRLIIMASRALAQAARSPDDYFTVYSDVLSRCDQPVILHWLGDMFDPALAGYWGSRDFAPALETTLGIIEANSAKIDGIKISLLDKEKEILMRRRLPAGVKMYTGDDFNYSELIAGDDEGYSHALLGIFDPIAPVVAYASAKLADGDVAGFRDALDPTVPLARLIFRQPTQFYKTGVVFLAWLNGFQDHFVMLGGAQAMRPLSYFVDIFKLADSCGLLRDPNQAVARLRKLFGLYGV